MKRRFVTLDVFTHRRFSGNPLAVVLDCDELNTEKMQIIAREFNLSETVFLFPPTEKRQRAKMRIFTPASELPFAGHPTIGTAVLLALHDQGGRKGARNFGLECSAGIIPCAVEILKAGRGKARFRAPVLPRYIGQGAPVNDVAKALGLDPHDIGFGHHEPTRHGVSGAFDFIPIATIEALQRITPRPHLFDDVFGAREHQAIYAYTNEPLEAGNHFHARMFAPQMGIAEDPATGSAAVAFAGVLMEFEHLGEGTHTFMIEQGFEMGRPSIIELQFSIREGALHHIEIGGEAVVIMNGSLRT